MGKFLMFAMLAMLIIGLITSPAVASEDTKPLVSEARNTVKQFGGELKGELKTAMQAGGPTNAIQVCNQVAPAIAANLSTQYKGNVRRTSLKFRNPGNKPDSWEQQVLQTFEKRKTNGEPAAQLEFYEVVETDGKRTFRYMKAIPTGEVCLGCHGTDIKPPVATKLDKLYPDDKARGFVKGDIRGAFSLMKSM